MRMAAFSDLDLSFGPDNVAKLASAYEAALFAASRGLACPAVDRETRLAIVTSLIAEARRGLFDPEHLTRTALGAIGVAPASGMG